MIDYDVTLLKSRMEINISPDDKASLKDILHVIPQWRLTVTITVKYLRDIYALVMK